VRVEGLKTLAKESISAQILKRIALGAETNTLTSLLQGLGRTNLALPEKPLFVPRPGITIITNRGQVENLPPGIWAAGKAAPLDGDGVLPVTLRNLLMKLASFDDSSIKSLAAILSPADADFLREIVHVLHQPGMTPSETVLTPALEHWWDNAMRTRVSGALRRMWIKASSYRQN
jgi:hypothetical protein